MKAARIHGPGVVSYDTVDDPKIKEDRDIILKVTATAICGSDLHIYSGGIPQPRPMVLGHEFMGIVEETGKAITNLKRGDRVVVPFPIACGGCFFCNHHLPGHCENSNPEHYGPEGGILLKKAVLYLATLICMVVTMAARQNMFVCLMLIMVLVWCRIIYPMNRFYFLQIFFLPDTQVLIGAK